MRQRLRGAEGRKGGIAVGMLVALSWGIASGVTAQAPGAAGNSPGGDLKVYLITMGAGAQVWERFGHNAIHIHDPSRGTDEAYNYGLFDFGQESFLRRFIQGRMWYWMAGFPTEPYLQQYVRDNRSVWIQELEMPAAERLALRQFLEWNALPENRFYHYDYYLDNCSTRVRDALDRFLGGRIRTATEERPTGATYRFHTQRLTSNDAPIFTGLLLALGPGTDRPITAWEEMFLPFALRDHIRDVTVPGPEGTPVPLVKSERTWFASTAPDPPEAPPRWTGWYLLIGLALGGTALLLGRGADRHRGARLGFGVVLGSWGLAVGVAGVVLAGLWGFTDHEMAYRNENLLQANPLALLLAGIAPWWLRRGAGAQRLARRVAWLLAALGLAGFAIQVLPAFDQVNGPIIALLLPVHLGIAMALGHPPTRAAPARASANSGAAATARR